ncbi:hypothetical protein ACFLQU_05130 [Verrucomicrobiota bacterium]
MNPGTLIPILHWTGKLFGQKDFTSAAADLNRQFGWQDSYVGALLR